MTKRRYGLIDSDGRFKIYTNYNIDCYYHFYTPRSLIESKKYKDVFGEAFRYSCGFDNNVAIALKDDCSAFCVWDTNDKKNTYKEFVIK